MKKFSPLIRFLLLLLAGLAAGLATAYLWMTPRVVGFQPGSGDRAGGFAAITITFNTSMDPECASRHIVISPPAAGKANWQGSVYRFTPAELWPEEATVTVRVTAGACSSRGLPSLWDASYLFASRPSRVLFLQPGRGISTLRTADPTDGSTTDIFTGASAILGFDPSPKGERVAFSEQTALGADLWMLDLNTGAARRLLDCGEEKCLEPAFSPDGSWLAFQRGEPPTASISLLDPATGTETPIPSTGYAAVYPVWNSRGWLSYYDTDSESVLLDDLHGGRTYLPAFGDTNWAWSPDGSGLVIPEEITAPESDSGSGRVGSGASESTAENYYHLIRITAADNTSIDLSGDTSNNDASPAFSPDGKQLAFTRQKFGADFTFGRQLWMLDLASRTARPLTHDGAYNYSAIRWSPNGKLLTYMRFHVTAPLDPPEVWISAADGSHPLRLSVGGYLPRWLP